MIDLMRDLGYADDEAREARERALIDTAEAMTADEIHQHPMVALDKLRALARELRSAEQALTPTNDEREALISDAHTEADNRYGATDWTDGPGSSTFRRVDRGKAGAFVDGALWRDSRSVVPEPSAEHAYRGNRSQDTCWVVVDGKMCRKPIEAHPEPQGEPSDALTRRVALAIRNGMYLDEARVEMLADDEGEFFDQVAHAALRAASAVTEQGENR